MAASKLPEAKAAMLAVVLLAEPLAAQAQAQAPVDKAAAAGRPAQQEPDTSEDRIFALVQAGKCGQAKAAAEQANDANLAGQIGLMCGMKPSASGRSPGDGGARQRGGGGGAGGGRRGGP